MSAPCKAAKAAGCFSVVVAATEAGGIGLDGQMPWRLPKDLAYFKRVTTAAAEAEEGQQNVVIMGRKTWDSIPAKFAAPRSTQVFHSATHIHLCSVFGHPKC